MTESKIIKKIREEPGAILFINPNLFMQKILVPYYPNFNSTDAAKIATLSVPIFGQNTKQKSSLNVDGQIYSMQRGLSLLIDGEIDDEFGYKKLETSHMPVFYINSDLYGLEINEETSQETRNNLKKLLGINVKNSSLTENSHSRKEDNLKYRKLEILLAKNCAPQKSDPLWPLFEPRKSVVNGLSEMDELGLRPYILEESGCYFRVGDFDLLKANRDNYSIEVDGKIYSPREAGIKLITSGYIPVQINFQNNSLSHPIYLKKFDHNNPDAVEYLLNLFSVSDDSYQTSISKTRSLTRLEIESKIRELF